MRGDDRTAGPGAMSNFHFHIDSAVWRDPVRCRAHIGGWVFAPADGAQSPQPVAGVRARMMGNGAGDRIWRGSCGQLRADVAAAFASEAATEHSGFGIELDDLDGDHGGQPLRIEVADEAGGWQVLAELDLASFAPPPPPPAYHCKAPDWPECQRIHHEAERLGYRPLISVVMPTYNTPEPYLRAALESVRNQLYEHWELCVIDDASTQPHVRRTLQAFAAQDSRIRPIFRAVNGNISAATNEALAAARGEFVALLDHDDELTENALFEIALALDEDPSLDLIYTDHDKKDESGRCVEPHFKPDWSPEYFRGVMYVGHLLCVRRALLAAIGGFRSAYDGVQDYEAALRLSERTTRIHHVPKVLYHWRMLPGSFAQATDAKAHCAHLQAGAVSEHLGRLGLSAHAEDFAGGHRARIVPAPRTTWPKVSIIIPTKDAPDYLERCLESIFRRSSYPNFECVLGDNGTTHPRALALMRQYACVRVDCTGPFNFSRVNNRCVEVAEGDFLLFLNNDTEVITPDWIEQLLYFAEQPDVGAVGALLLYPDQTVQHAGVILGPRGTADHLMRGFPRAVDGYAGSLVASREVSAVTAACLMVKRTLFEEIGGFNEHYFTHYQDVDLCLALRRAGKRNIFTPNAELFHHESVSRKAYYDMIDRNLLLDRWDDLAGGDPYYNPNFDSEHDDYRLRAAL